MSETASPLACLLTSGTTVGQETELDDGHTIVVRREPETLVLLDRHPDASRFHPQSIYHRSNLDRFFGLVESQQREWLFRRRVFGVATEPLDEAKFYNERAEIEAMDRAALQEAAKRSGEGEPGHEQEQQQPLAARGLPVPMEEVEGESQDPADRLIALLAELPSLSLDSLEILQEFCTHSSAYQRENTRVGFNTVNPHRMNALRVFRTLVDISATPAMTSSFLAEVRKFIGLRTNSIAQTSLRQGKKVQPYYEWMERISQRVTLADLAQMGSLPTNDFGNQARAFPSLHWSARMEEEHLKVQSRGRMEIYSHTGAMVTSHLLNSYRLVDAEWDGWMARMLGADHYRRHFWHRRNVHLLRRHYGQVQDSLQWLARVFQFMACEVDLEDRLFYIDRNFPEQKDPQFRVYVPQLKAMLKKMLVAFFQLMLQFSRLSGLLAPFVSEAFCAFTAEKLGIRYCHRIVSQIPRFLHGFVFADLAQEEFTKVVEAWCDEVLVETEAQRKRRLAHFQVRLILSWQNRSSLRFPGTTHELGHGQQTGRLCVLPRRIGPGPGGRGGAQTLLTGPGPFDRTAARLTGLGQPTPCSRTRRRGRFRPAVGVGRHGGASQPTGYSQFVPASLGGLWPIGCPGPTVSGLAGPSVCPAPSADQESASTRLFIASLFLVRHGRILVPFGLDGASVVTIEHV